MKENPSVKEIRTMLRKCGEYRIIPKTIDESRIVYKTILKTHNGTRFEVTRETIDESIFAMRRFLYESLWDWCNGEKYV